MPQSILYPNQITIFAQKKTSTAHRHNPLTKIVTNIGKRSSARLASLLLSVNRVAQLNAKFLPQQQKAALAKAKLLEAEQRASTQEDTIGKAQVIRTLLEMKIFFSDAVDGGLFVTQMGSKLRVATNLEDNPMFYVLETLDRVFETPGILREVPGLEFSEQLAGSEDAYFSRFVVRHWTDRVDSLLLDLLQPLLSLPKISQRFQLWQAWKKMCGDPLRRALDLARLARMWYIVGEHQRRISMLAKERVWSKWKPLWVRTEYIIHECAQNRRYKCLRAHWICWVGFVETRVWESIAETKIDIGWRLLRNIYIRRALTSCLRKWKKNDGVVISKEIKIVRRENNQSLLRAMLISWQELVNIMRESRQSQALSLLLKCTSSVRRSSDIRHQLRIASVWRKQWIQRQTVQQWQQWRRKQQRLRVMIIHAVERLARANVHNVTLAFFVWRNHARSSPPLPLSDKKTKTVKVQRINTCHSCDHVRCPQFCRYVCELKKMRSQWRHIEL
jgi:hypothetical protein